MKISIIIPTIGRKTLKKVLESVFLSKNFDQINPEILVVFDGKKEDFLDITPSLFEKYIDLLRATPLKLRGDEIRIVETGKKVFASGARNLGIKKSTGDILVFMGDNGIVDGNWLEKIFDFHKKNPKKEKCLLGNVFWGNSDKFTEFFENNFQFDFKNLERGKIPNWKHFYTSNISLKREFLNITPSLRATPLKLRGDKEDSSLMLFSEKFNGWGFEDSEFGYRLQNKGMKIIYDKTCKVLRLDTPNYEDMIKKIKSARKNAKIFERLHPEVKILPKGFKLFILKILIIKSFLPAKFNQKIFWWREWKKAWIGWK